MTKYLVPGMDETTIEVEYFSPGELMAEALYKPIAAEVMTAAERAAADSAAEQLTACRGARANAQELEDAAARRLFGLRRKQAAERDQDTVERLSAEIVAALVDVQLAHDENMRAASETLAALLAADKLLKERQERRRLAAQSLPDAPPQMSETERRARLDELKQRLLGRHRKGG